MSTVTFSPVTAVLQNYPAGTVVIGKPGSGKTYFLLNLAANCFMTSTRFIFIDFKNDSLALKKINKDVKITDINKIKPGALNPFKVLKHVDTNTLISVIRALCGDLTSHQINSISPIVKDFVIENRRNLRGVDFSTLANYLYAADNEHAQTVGTILKNHEDSAYGSLLFYQGEDEDEPLTVGKESQIISLFGLTIPGQDSSKWNEEERFTSTIIYIICKMLNDVLSGNDKKDPVVLFVDESHIMYGSDFMSEVIEKLLVLGRSLNICTVLSSQNMTHYPHDISQLIANKFMFSSSPGQAKEFLDRFDSSDPDDENGLDRKSIINFISDASEGLCFMLDYKNRPGYIQIKSNLGVTSNPLIRDEPEETGTGKESVEA